jgi:hypothetical protein
MVKVVLPTSKNRRVANLAPRFLIFGIAIFCSSLALGCSSQLEEKPVVLDKVIVESETEISFIRSSPRTTLVLRLFESGFAEADCIRATGKEFVEADRKRVRVQTSPDEVEPLLSASRAVPEFTFDHVEPNPSGPLMEYYFSTSIVLNFPSGKQGVFDIRNGSTDLFLKGKNKSHDKYRVLLNEIYKARESLCKDAFSQ